MPAVSLLQRPLPNAMCADTVDEVLHMHGLSPPGLGGADVASTPAEVRGFFAAAVRFFFDALRLKLLTRVSVWASNKN